ncbi:MAG: SAM-dependent methyltransferase, partial [Thermoplasmata archaeon]
LKKLDVGKVTLRIDIDPKEYWSLRNEIERDLMGEKKIHLFRMEDRALIAERESS